MSKTVLFQIIQFSVSTQFNCQKQFYFKLFSLASIHNLVLFDPLIGIWCYHPRPEWTWERLQWRGTPHSPKLHHHWSLTIRFFNAISGHSSWGVLSFCREVVDVIYSFSKLGKLNFDLIWHSLKATINDWHMKMYQKMQQTRHCHDYSEEEYTNPI